MALGKNPLIGFMTWEGYNYEDAVLLSERLVQDDVYTSVHIEEYEAEARNTKLGDEEITKLRDDDLTALRRRRIGFVFQAFNLVPTLTVKENIRLPFELDDRRPNADERAWITTVIHRLGLVRLLMFFSIEPLWDGIAGQLRLAGLPTWQLDGLWPGVTDVAWVSFVIYLVVFDFVNYWVHRGQHQLNAWWALHSLHHSQRQMTMWSDNRNHLLDDVIVATVFALLARLIGVEPGQFVAITVITQLHESLQHANLRLGFGRIGERLLVSPRFHRLHHSIGIGHESDGRGTLGGHNFGVLLPVWDILFRTANFDTRFDPTGVRDQLPEEGGRDYGRGFWSQQWLGLLRFFASFKRAT